LARSFIDRILSELKQKRDVLEIGSAQLSLSDDGEIPTLLLCIGAGGAELWLQFDPMSKQITAVLNLSQKWTPVLCEPKVGSIGDEQVRCVAPLFVVGVFELYGERLLFVLRNILVEDQMLDEVALQTRFITDARSRLIIGYQASDAPIVGPDLSNRHPLSSLPASSNCELLSLNSVEICSPSRTLPRTSPFVQHEIGYRRVCRLLACTRLRQLDQNCSHRLL
jgi:hypothetical protein